VDEHIYKRHNKSLLLYHLVFPIKYRIEVLTKEIGESLKLICIGISERYEVQFVEIGYESDHVHFLVQSVPSISYRLNIKNTVKGI
jgi:putative transposase